MRQKWLYGPSVILWMAHRLTLVALLWMLCGN